MKKYLLILLSFIFYLQVKGEYLADGFYKIIPANYIESALTYNGWGASQGEMPFIFKKSGAMVWFLNNSSEGIYIQVPGYNIALTVPNNENGESIIFSNMEPGVSIGEYSPYSNQIWIPETSGNNTYILRLKENPNLVATLKEKEPEKFEMILDEYTGNINQKWILNCEKTLEIRRQEIEQERKNKINNLNYEYVDLGLPSKLLWATKDIGSKSPEKPGYFYKWAEIKSHTSNREYDISKRKQLMNEAGDISGSPLDAARQFWMGDWRIPNLKEAQELVKNCKWEEITINGTKCFKVIGPNGNHIILPVTGYYNALKNEYESQDNYGLRWTSTRAIYKPGIVFSLGTSHNPEDPYRFVITQANYNDAMPIRAVIGKGIQDEDSFLAEKSGEAQGYAYVDLGLSVKWATQNVGAQNPWEYGSSFARGEIAPKEKFPETNSGYDLKNIGGSRYDAATQNWGDDWRLPSLDEFKELLSECSWEYVCIKGHYGYRVTGPNGNSIFLPSAGIGNYSGIEDREQDGVYWSSTGIVSSAGFTISRQSDKVFEGYVLEFDSDQREIVPLKIYMGASVRPVFGSSLKNSGYPSPLGHSYRGEKDGIQIMLEFISEDKLKVSATINGKPQTETIGWEQINDVIRTSGNVNMTIDKSGNTIEDMANYKTTFKKVK